MKKINKTNQTSMQKGFSLIELMVVLVIIGVLTAIVISQFAKAAQKNRILETTNLMGAVQSTIHDVTQMDLGRVIDDNLLIKSDRIAQKYINTSGLGVKNIVTPFGGQLTVNGVANGTEYTIKFDSMSQQACDSLSNSALMSDAKSIVIDAKTIAKMDPNTISTSCEASANKNYPVEFTFKR
ncbi:type 4 pilus major pilin [Cysteiniphilum sp. QT6929]|uniref:type II secretion system protein n=1 Tax=Cysteiniphilum sp. QT6929 TaxID=2975055 RepID=UPI0024B34A40|nr:type 4 pilus major pilin [Cysteiniphilum sp. QT6929]WHN64831.1 prepilin-type N-terminal cleavage/methylation domain-containing protein [Cysteiniphilum sp. QT6929]